MFSEIVARNFLSFGPDTPPVKLGPLNVFIGPNASGKSNLLDVFELLRALPDSLDRHCVAAGGVRTLLWRGRTSGAVAEVSALASLQTPKDGSGRYRIIAPYRSRGVRYSLEFSEMFDRPSVLEERFESDRAEPGHVQPYKYLERTPSRTMINVRGVSEDGSRERTLAADSLLREESVFSQRNDPDAYPEISGFSNSLRSIRSYRDWSIGRSGFSRLPQRADAPIGPLLADCSNLGVVLNRLRQNSDVRSRVRELLGLFVPSFRDVDVLIDQGSVQLVIDEGTFLVPATRLSDGTLRWLALLAVLLDPAPGPVTIIEEPEIGLHPDAVHEMAKLLTEASQRTQLLVTTHSESLVSALSDDVSSVSVVERARGCSTVSRLSPERLAMWLEQYSLGDLWRKGHLSGVKED